MKPRSDSSDNSLPPTFDETAHHEQFPSILDDRERRGQVLLRTLPILLIPFVVAIVIGLVVHFTLGDREARVPGAWSCLLPIIVVASFFIALVMAVRLGRANLSASLLIGAWTLGTVTLPFLWQASVIAIWPALLIAPISAAGLLMDGAASIVLAALATLLVLTLGWLQMEGLIPMSAVVSPGQLLVILPVSATAFWIAMFWMIAGLTYLLASGLQRSLEYNRRLAFGLRRFSNELEARVARQTAELLEQSQEAARLEERTRVARDIHDTLAQGLTGIVVQLGAAQRALEAESPDTAEHIELAQSMAREALAEARRSIWNLRAPALERGGLSDALQGLVERKSHGEIQIDFKLMGEVWQLASDVESSLLRVCQESLVNVTKHAGATEAHVVLEYAPDLVRLGVCDNGAGFDDQTLASSHGAQGPWDGFGLLGMRERIQQFGGTLTLSNEGGAQVEAIIPRERASHATPGPGTKEQC
jgi:signal transduction histidine kinase